jgi:hypothetical protein
MLRLGKKMLENNPNRNAYGFGVYIVTEIDKERKNSPELTDVSKKDDNCNQKNDLFNVMLKMSRHAAVISNRVFVKVIGDLQRPESLGADARELGEVVFIDGQSDMQPILPFFSPFWVFDLFFSLIKGSFERFYTQVRYVRADNTLFMYLLKRCYSAMQHFDERTCNLYGSAQINLKVESGRMNGDSLDRKYFRQSKKIWAKRYSTDCLSGIFEVRGELNTIGIDDLKEYADIMAVNDELLYQNSHFQNEIQLINKSN